MKLAGSVAVITGGARGIGLATSRSLAAAGARVVLADVLEEAVTAAAREIRAAGGEAMAVAADVTRDEDVQKVMEAAVHRYGALNIVCANAGIARDGLMLSRDQRTGRITRVLATEDFRAVVEVNLVGAFITWREGARRMADGGWPGLLLVISSVAQDGQPGQINYSSTKAAVAVWPKIVTGELHASGIRNIRAVGLAPGYTATEALKDLSPDTVAGIVKNVHLGRLVQPEELASTIAHVIENDAIDGTTIEVNCGTTYGAWQRAR